VRLDFLRSPAVQILLGTLAAFAVRGPVPDPPASGEEREALARWVRRNDLGPIFFRFTEPARRYPEQLAEWERSYQITWVRNSRAIAAATQLTRSLADHGIRALAMRGVRFGVELYGDGGLRPMTDVDLLLEQVDRERLGKIMGSLGFRPDKELRRQSVYVLNGMSFELHYSLLTPRRYTNLAGAEGFFERSRELPVEGGMLLAFSPEDDYTTTLMHAYYHHGFEKLLALYDLWLISQRPGLDRKRISQWAEDHEQTGLVQLTERLMGVLFAMSGPNRRDSPILTPGIPDAYLSRWLDQDRPVHYFRRKQHLIALSRGWALKSLQWLRLLSVDEISTLSRLVRRRQPKLGSKGSA
jgi:Uncharacterised nucleotidyltransferase